MSKHNYSQYSSNKHNNPEIVDSVSFETASIVDTSVSDVPVVEPVVEAVETATLTETVNGVVAHCAKLNVRAKPDAEAAVVCVLEAGSELEINVSKSTNDWVNVYTATGAEGYCMRKFVDAKV